ncbi:MAG: DUF411 domain-containing protein [Rhizobiales bacterium]|nr:DUF411 domain-containing protein [Hyphomicrobiales bacterium]
MMTIDRRSFLAALALAGAGGVQSGLAAGKPIVVIHKDASCGCCGAWADHIAAAGFPTRIVEDIRINAIKARLGVPAAMRSCHTAEVDGYVLEGHVPAAALVRLLADRPAVRGLAVPGMPVGSPGMEVPGAPAETFDVMAFGHDASSVFMRFQGSTQIDG